MEVHRPKFYPSELSFQVVGAAMEVHKALGPGFLEAVYHTALAHELGLQGVSFESHLALPVTYKGIVGGLRGRYGGR